MSKRSFNYDRLLTKIPKNKFILITGSASRDCPHDTLDLAVDFVRCFTREVLNRGGGVVVLGSDERSTLNERGVPRIFDWVVLREVENYASSTTTPQRRLAKVVMSDEARESKLSSDNLITLRNLEQREVVSVYYVPRREFTGGAYRYEQISEADGMLAIGGGKGTYSLGSEMTDLGKPVLPVDLQIGSMNEDGDGALGLHREMMDHSSRFFPVSNQNVVNKLGLVSLNAGINEVENAARVASELINAEFESKSFDKDATNSSSRTDAVLRWLKDRRNVQIALDVYERIKDIYS